MAGQAGFTPGPSSTGHGPLIPESAHRGLMSMYQDALGDSLKALEAGSGLSALSPTSPYVVRLDGVSFSKWLRLVDLVKPFDDRISRAFVKTTGDLVEKFNPTLGYTQSDEISLVFPAAMTLAEHDAWAAWEATKGLLAKGGPDPPLSGDTDVGAKHGQGATGGAKDANGPDESPSVGDPNAIEIDLLDEEPQVTSPMSTGAPTKRKAAGGAPETSHVEPSPTPESKRQATEAALTPAGPRSQGKAAKRPSPKPRKPMYRPHMYSGRIQKLVSVISSYAAVRFNFHMAHEYKHSFGPDSGPAQVDSAGPSSKAGPDLSSTPHTPAMPGSAQVPASPSPPDLPSPAPSPVPGGVQGRRKPAESPFFTAYFDARIIECPSADMATDCVYWRSNYDGLRNAINRIAQAEFPHAKLQKLSVMHTTSLLAKDKGIHVFRDYDPKWLYGVWVKRELYELPGPSWNPHTGTPVPGPVVRCRNAKGSFNWADWPAADRTAFTMAKYWPAPDATPNATLAPPAQDPGGL